MTFKFPAIDTTDRADDRVIYWDATAGVHKYKAEAAAGGAVLASASHAPGSNTSIATTTSATFADVDATNLVVAFNAPASGVVTVQLLGMVDSGGTTNTHWNLRDGSGDISGTERFITNSGAILRLGVTIRVAGLTPGNPYTWKWGHARATGSTTVTLRGGPTWGPATMEVRAA
jgi:hypothetical protein